MCAAGAPHVSVVLVICCSHGCFMSSCYVSSSLSLRMVLFSSLPSGLLEMVASVSPPTVLPSVPAALCLPAAAEGRAPQDTKYSSLYYKKDLVVYPSIYIYICIHTHTHTHTHINSLHLLTLNSESLPLPPHYLPPPPLTSPLATTSLFSMSVSISQMSSSVSHFRSNTWYLSLSFWPPSRSTITSQCIHAAANGTGCFFMAE